MIESAEGTLLDTILGWNALEKRQKGDAVVDFNVSGIHKATHYKSRYDVLTALVEQQKRQSIRNDRLLAKRAKAHETYLRALMGQQIPFETYIANTQAFPVTHFDEDYVAFRRDRLRTVLHDVGLTWDKNTEKRLDSLDEKIPRSDLVAHFRNVYDKSRPDLEHVVDKPLSIRWRVEFVNIDAYWEYWVDGNERRFRLRINGSREAFRYSQVVQFVFHEVLAHCCQIAAWRREIENGRLGRYCGITTVHGPEQFAIEGLAQCLPLMLADEFSVEPLVKVRVYLSHLVSLVNNNVHIMVNSGDSIEDCVRYVQRHLPFTDASKIAAGLASRSTNVQFRTYQFVYPKSADTFVKVAETGDLSQRKGLMKECYAKMLCFDDIVERYAW